ncbi:uncharacterized protein LOC112685601 [Sipha flava]|uniref:Uncharacterized protein LOC112685601 n=2 Tax=Sipha flava TaxID=143950 RepID=A0A8B8FQU1_9HEMI|nr:uncharacterized protein LOC112685601 [Sipha flava]
MPEEKVILINQKSSFTQNNSTLKRKIKPNAKVTINNKKITDGTIAGSTSLVKVNPSEDREKDSTLKKYTKPKEKVTLINQKSNFTQKNSTLKRKIKPNEKVTLNNKKITDATIAGSTSLVKVNPSEDREKDSTLKQKTKLQGKNTIINQKRNSTDVNNASKALLIDFDRSIGHKKRLLLIKKLNLKKKL